MIFNLFKTSARAVRDPGKLYMTQQRQDEGVIQEIINRSATDTVLLVVHFDDTLRRLRAACEHASIELTPPVRSPSEIYSAARSVCNRSALLIISRDAKALSTMSRQGDPARSFTLIVADMHPTRSREQQVDALADAIPGKTRIIRFGSLEDPIMRRFAGEMTMKFLKLLGADQSTVMEDKRVWTGIERAQKSIEAKATSDHDAVSCAMWLDRNLPS